MCPAVARWFPEADGRMPLPELPSSIADALTALHKRGFVARSDVAGGMGGRELVLDGQVVGRNVGVRVTGDRGNWTLAIQVGVDGPWLPPYLWSAELAHRPIEGPHLAA